MWAITIEVTPETLAVSSGAAVFKAGTMTCVELIGAADAAIYREKVYARIPCPLS
jgi:hypothetical protein